MVFLLGESGDTRRTRRKAEKSALLRGLRGLRVSVVNHSVRSCKSRHDQLKNTNAPARCAPGRREFEQFDESIRSDGHPAQIDAGVGLAGVGDDVAVADEEGVAAGAAGEDVG